jgi:IS605 OrfB family transposase
VKLTIQLQVLPDVGQRQRLLETMERTNEAATFAARKGFDAGVFSQPSIHKLAYAEIRSRLGLSAQMTVRAIGKAVESFSRDKSVCPVFKPHGAITYDERIFSFKGIDRVSLWALPEGRMIIPLIYGEYQKQRFDRIKGQADLVYRQKKFYLFCAVNLPDKAPVKPTDFLGVDLGVANIASDSDGKRHSGSQVKSVRYRHRRLRSKLQKKQTRAAKRRLQMLSGRERRFATHVNHCISKQIVAEAERSGRGIAIEDLTGIRERVKALRKQRAVVHSWAFSQLRLFLEYKARGAGVVLITVDPRNTSRACSICGHCEKKNRLNQSEFRCRSCGYESHADTNAAANIRSRAVVNQPNLTSCSTVSHGAQSKAVCFS